MGTVGCAGRTVVRDAVPLCMSGNADIPRQATLGIPDEAMAEVGAGNRLHNGIRLAQGSERYDHGLFLVFTIDRDGNVEEPQPIAHVELKIATCPH